MIFFFKQWGSNCQKQKNSKKSISLGKWVKIEEEK